MSAFTCPQKDDDGIVCGARVELTRKSYLALDEKSGQVIDAGPGESWDVYCENDHPLGEDFDDPQRVRDFLANYNS